MILSVGECHGVTHNLLVFALQDKRSELGSDRPCNYWLANVSRTSCHNSNSYCQITVYNRIFDSPHDTSAVYQERLPGNKTRCVTCQENRRTD